ncbi:TIGR04282 family arsenosugar biosynthesis glycosyltransferase [Wenyingzhuangia aestuarii]|uniref:TIGR04282 family arsenosugar biosynthesis glycosyltransferase n=1 Tax=Wenyingzhuangia aestuarii TaxID=1647582 RepID=UPI00143C755D|nr:DUF2064 domain-containing protein [Wenyingzhuangia aestuarii]NJB83084.1 hypothetical protein [Wenyingzhuangia aestuarii]
MSHKTAFLIFAQSATAESKQIPNAELLFEQLNLDILKKVRQTNMPYFVSNEQDQVGNDFGAKLTNALSKVFKKGYDYVITVGNDTPEITTGILKKSIKNTAKKKLTFGPSKDGGFYLMTFSKKEFQSEEYQKLPWQTSSLVKNTLLLLNNKSNHKLVLLSPLKDIDTLTDLTSLFLQHNHISLALKELFKLLIFIKKTKVFYKNSHFTSFINTCFYNKGSPIFLSL